MAGVPGGTWWHLRKGWSVGAEAGASPQAMLRDLALQPERRASGFLMASPSRP